MSRKKRSADYQALAMTRGFRCLNPQVAHVMAKTWWECDHGHRWEASYNSIQQGKGCPFCAGNARKEPADYHAVAKEHGIVWLGPEVTNNSTKTWWKCQEGHRWEAPYSSIQQGKGCPICAGNTRKEPEDYHALAKERGFFWLGPIVLNTGTPTGWECEKGHIWRTTYNSIQQGTGCPFCAGKARKTPLDYHALARQRGFRWLGPEVPNIKTKTTWECGEGHHWEACYKDIKRGRGCPICAGLRRKTPADYNALAQERGFGWLGPEVRNNQTRTSWRCEHGHQWEATYGSIQQGRGCPVCAGLLRKEPADYHMLAKERGLRWLGPPVPNNQTKTTWQCAEGHKWEANYGSIQQGTGCPTCAGLTPKTPEDYHDLASERGFKWLGPEVPNSHTKTGWQCPQGHVWEAEYNSIRSGTGCPTCVDFVNGAQVSQIQRDLATMLGGILNHRSGKYYIDVALHVDNTRIAIEYDSWYWHAHQQDRDAQREKKLIAAGWKVLRIKSNFSLPGHEQLNLAIAQLLDGKSRSEIVLDDWGRGPSRLVKD